MFTLPNIITLVRIPCALLFLQDNPMVRTIALLVAMASDWLDGHLARRYAQTTRLGTLLDPIMDKIFVFFVLAILLEEQKIALWQIAAMLCRDMAISIFGFYLILRRKFGRYKFRSIWFGKVSTTLQFLVILALTMNFQVPATFFISFVLLGPLALFELYFPKIRSRLAR